MVGSPSSEFIALCQSQVLLLTQALGAVSTVIYLAEARAESVDPTLVPLVAYPETAERWSGLKDALSLGSEEEIEVWGGYQAPPQADGQHRGGGASDLGGEADPRPSSEQPSEASLVRPISLPPAGEPQRSSSEPDAESAYPLVLPLTYDGVVLGMMVSTRQLQPWTAGDYQQAEQVATTLAIACVMDQRQQWLQRQLTQRQLTQADQSETFHDLLHQFRNPLTALQTFGKLIVKRLPAEDINLPIAEGIVRESRRLQDLAQHFDDAVLAADETLGEGIDSSPKGLLLPASRGAEPQAGAKPDPNNSGSGDSPETATAALPQSHGLGRSLRVVPGAIAAVALPLVQSTLPLAEEKGLRLVHHIPSPLPQVWLDASALGEVLHNLLDNALKYAPAGALVWVTAGLVQHLNGEVYQGIAVGNTGAGIPLDDQRQLFTRYFRGVQAQGDIPGTGLGLAIVSDLVQGMGGHIDLISPVQGTPWLPPEARAYAPSPGTLFVVWLRSHIATG
jgi:signal transduction histidine kinase